MSSEKEVKILHSGLNNKNPENDLGGLPSQFEIAELPANNLFNDITPEKAKEGWTDYRCFYVMNKYQDSDYDIYLNSTAASCTSINVGSVVSNDEQKIIFQGPNPSTNGFFIIKLDWGPELTVEWGGSYSAMASDMQALIQLLKYHENVTVAFTTTFPGDTGAEFTVTFAGQLQNRKMGLIRIVQNNLWKGASREYRVNNGENAIFNGCNYAGQSKVQVERIIDGAPFPGMIHIPYPTNDINDPSTWVFMHLPYSTYSGKIFNLSSPIPMNLGPETNPTLGNNDEVWVDMSVSSFTSVNVARIQEGSPINQIAELIGVETNPPIDWTDQGSSFHVGLIKPLEGFFIWAKRETNAGSGGCRDGFSITLNGTRVS